MIVPVDRVDQVGMAGDLVSPGRRVGVLEVGHEASGARVQRVDHQLAVGRADDLDPAVGVVGTRRGGLPGGVLPYLPGLGEEVEPAAGGDGGVAPRAGGEQLPAASVEAAVQLRQEGERVGREDLGAAALVEGQVGDRRVGHRRIGSFTGW